MRYNARFSRLFVLMLLLVMSGVRAAPHQQANLFQLFLLNTRTDLELLADEILGVDVRPELWTANEDLTTETFVSDLWFDTELIANEIYGVNQRPEDWLGVTSANLELVARNVRHDLELAATQVYGTSRPEAWEGASPIYTCSRTLQNLVRLLDIIYNTRPSTPPGTLGYCETVSQEIQDELFATVLSSSDFSQNTPALIAGVRGDVERLADELNGLETRPANWIGNREAETPSFVSDLYIDLEALADEQLGANTRPDAWISTPSLSPVTAAQNLRFNLELLADLTLSADRRPSGWQGINPAARCEPSLQSLLTIVEQNISDVTPPADTTDATAYCRDLTQTTNDLAENPPVVTVAEAEQQDTRYLGKSRYAFAYLDVAALQYMGIMPLDTQFRAWYRNFNESNMMFVSGQDFALFIDRRFTTLTEEVFRTLPTLEGRRPLTFCDADWCNGPGPTPTPTGSGPVALVLQLSTPPATRDVAEVSASKRLVSWNNVKVFYLFDPAGTGTAQVSLQICADSSQTACEEVRSVFDNATGTLKPVIQTVDGRNVYEFQYGYQSNLIIEGDTLYATDVWISDPSVR